MRGAGGLDVIGVAVVEGMIREAQTKGYFPSQKRACHFPVATNKARHSEALRETFTYGHRNPCPLRFEAVEVCSDESDRVAEDSTFG